MVSRVAGGERIRDVARQMGVSRQTASKWLARARRGEPMSDRSSTPRRLARLTPPDVEARVREARSSMLLAPLALAAATGVPARTCARIVARAGLPRLADVDRVTGECLCQLRSQQSGTLNLSNSANTPPFPIFPPCRASARHPCGGSSRRTPPIFRGGRPCRS